jgi:3-oxoacyl-[acyl-carrier-protein] synthase-1
MAAQTLAIQRTGLVCSVGLGSPAACAAIRAKLTNPVDTRFMDANGEWIVAHEVPTEQPWRGLDKLARMAALAIEECLQDLPREDWSTIPLLLCVAERERPGRTDGLDDQLFERVQQVLGTRFAADSSVVAHGRVGSAVALAAARTLLQQGKADRVVVAATDSLLTWPTLSAYERGERLLTARNSNGFMPGEAAGALLLGRPSQQAELRCSGIGFGVEAAHIDSGEPLRADGLSAAIRQALSDAGKQPHEMDFRITDVSGEQYYFKEAALALSRTLRVRKDAFDIWHPAESIGETGAVAGVAMLSVAEHACRKGYSIGPSILAHMANDSGQRAAAVLHYVAAP